MDQQDEPFKNEMSSQLVSDDEAPEHQELTDISFESEADGIIVNKNDSMLDVSLKVSTVNKGSVRLLIHLIYIKLYRNKERTALCLKLEHIKGGSVGSNDCLCLKDIIVVSITKKHKHLLLL